MLVSFYIRFALCHHKAECGHRGPKCKGMDTMGHRDQDTQGRILHGCMRWGKVSAGHTWEQDRKVHGKSGITRLTIVK